MHILKVGLNHKTAPVEIREKVTFNEDELPEALQTLRHTKTHVDGGALRQSIARSAPGSKAEHDALG